MNKRIKLFGRKSLTILIGCTLMTSLFMISISQDAMAKAGNTSIKVVPNGHSDNYTVYVEDLDGIIALELFSKTGDDIIVEEFDCQTKIKLIERISSSAFPLNGRLWDCEDNTEHYKKIFTYGDVVVDCLINSAVDSDVFVDEECMVGSDGSVDGNIKVEGDDAHLRLYGELDGDVQAKDCKKVVVDKGASVAGNIKVENCEFDPNIFDVVIGTTTGPGGDDDIVTITGNVEVKGSDLQIGDFAEIHGNVKVEDGTCNISALAIIHGNLEGDCQYNDDDYD